MTAIVTGTTAPDAGVGWSTPAGWGIYADLTPPELASGRRLKRIRRLLVVALVAIVVLVIAGLVYARWQSHLAANQVAAQQVRTTQLIAEQQSYSSVTALQASIAGVRGDIATLMVADVGFGSVLGSIQTAVPRGMAINQETVTVNAAAAAGSAVAGGTSLDTSGDTVIGTINSGGTVTTLDGLAAYVANLQNIPGVIDVIPGTSQVTAGSVTFTVTMSVTETVLSHRFDVVPTTAATAAVK